MAWLFIDAARPRAYRVGLLGVRTVRVRESLGRSHGIVIECMSWLKKLGKEPLHGVCVVAGPGSFTSIRTGVIVGTMIARLRGVSLIGVSCEDAVDLERLRTECFAGTRQPTEHILPLYDAEPNITIAQPILD